MDILFIYFIITLIAIFIFWLKYKLSLVSEQQKENRKLFADLQEDRTIAEYNYDNVWLDMKIWSYIDTGMFWTQFKIYVLYDLLSWENDFVVNWVDCRWIQKSTDLKQLMQFAEWYKTAILLSNNTKNKSKDTDDTIIIEKLIHSNHREITKDLMNHINAYNSFAKYLRLNHKDHNKYDKKIYEYYDALWDHNKITSRRLWMFSEITEQQIQEGK